MILQLILWLAIAIHGGSHINGCLTDTWHGHKAVIHISTTHGVVTHALTRKDACS